MELITHFTSKKAFRKIKEEGFLNPLSDPFARDYYASQTARRLTSNIVKDVVQYQKYLVGIPSKSFKKWESSGLLENILKLTTGEVKLQFALTNLEGVFLREAKYLSKDYFKEDCGINLWAYLKDGKISQSQFVCRKYHRRYIKSTTAIDDYKGQFEIPEIWIPRKISINHINCY